MSMKCCAQVLNSVVGVFTELWMLYVQEVGINADKCEGLQTKNVIYVPQDPSEES